MKRILLCPACNSREVVLDSGGYTGKYRCLNCGYVGVLVLETTEGGIRVAEEEKSVEEKERERKRH